MMVILAFYLTPSKSLIVNKSFLGAAQQVGNLSQMDWSDFTASQLLKESRNSRILMHLMLLSRVVCTY